MNSVSVAMASSDVIRQLVRERGDVRASSGSAEARLRLYRTTVRMVEVMQTIIGPFKPVPQINLYLRSGT